MIQKEILKEVILENRQEVMRHDVIRREVTITDFPCQVLVGVRRSGKSYILYGYIQQLIREGKTWDDIVYINFEDERLLGMEVSDLNAILEVQGELSAHRPIVFLDEIQNIENWEKFARRLADSKYSVFITGSNAKMLSSDVATTLGGRYLVKEVYPFSFSEYLRAVNVDCSDVNMINTTEGRGILKRHFEEFFKFGGFPEAIPLPSKRDYLTSLYQKLYLGDIAARHKIENVFALRVMYRKLSESVKQPVSYTRITNIVASTGKKIGKTTIINYVDFSMEACLILPITNYADNLTDRLTKRKYYFVDNGIISLLCTDARTSLLENLVAISLIRKYGKEDAVYYYGNGVEVDFYVPEEDMAVQVCYSLEKDNDTAIREISALVKMNQRIPCKRNVIIAYDEQKTIQQDGLTIEVIPVWRWLLPANEEKQS